MTGDRLEILKGQWKAIWPIVFFIVTMGLNFALVTRNMDAGYLAGHEFRQTQTALSIQFIEKDQNFSLAYPTPVFGPPWSIPMEFPLYQWVAATLAKHFDWSVAFSGRVVGIICFYLSLPAVGLLALRAGSTRA